MICFITFSFYFAMHYTIKLLICQWCAENIYKKNKFEIILILLLTFLFAYDIMYTEKERKVFNNDRTKS